MTVPNTLPIPHNGHSAHTCTAISFDAGLPTACKEKILAPCLADAGAHDDLAMIVTTPSSITERPLLSSNSSRECREWYRQLKPPYAMLAISCVQVGLYALLVGGGASNARTMQALLFDPQRQRELWRFVTYMLLHKDGVHLLQNVLLQCLFGIYLETSEASWKILGVYVGGGVGGALGAAAVCADLIVGASAGVYALLLSYVSHIILNYTTMKYRRHLIISVGVIIVSDIVYCAFHYFYNASPTISGGAHLFGALHGLLIGLILFASGGYNIVQARCDSKNYTKIVSIIALITLILVFFGLVIADVKNKRSKQSIKPH